ncbi:MAG TPA: alkaline phosphatase D family protein [Caulobacteraceae bacterium]|nr:alkaline phosphatase D family protein [Caulobacteraceae bacterium]
MFNPVISALPGRREILSLGGAAGAALLVGPRAFGAAGDPFALGVASGDPAPDGFVLWTRISKDPLAADGRGGMHGPVQVKYLVAEDQAMRKVVRRGTAAANSTFAHSVHVEIAGLQSGRDYFYRFEALGAQSPVGRARTAPARGAKVERLTLAFASCAHYEVGFFSAYRHIAEEHPDVVFFLGDYIYEYSYTGARGADLPRHHDYKPDLMTLAQYRNRYALHKLDPDLRQLHEAATQIATWDDHEVENDYSGGSSQDIKQSAQAFEKRRRAAYQAFWEHMPLRRRKQPHPTDMRIYDRYRFGDLAEITLPDERQYRTPQPCPTAGSRRGHVAPLTCPDLEANDRTMLGFPQERWLYDGFRKPHGKWNIVAQQLLVAPLDQETTDNQPGRFTEGWSGYGANRRRMIAAMDQAKLRNAVFFGGDMHCFMVTDLKADDRDQTSKIVATEFVGTSITSDGPGAALARSIPQNPQVKLFETRYRGYMTAEVTPRKVDVNLRAISDRTKRDATVSTYKHYVVEDGRAGAQDG